MELVFVVLWVKSLLAMLAFSIRVLARVEFPFSLIQFSANLPKKEKMATHAEVHYGVPGSWLQPVPTQLL